MSGQKAAGTVFVDDSVDTRAPTRSPDAPVSSRDIIGANATLTYQDMAGQPLQAKIDAYTPIINELDKRDTRSWAEKVFGQQYLTAATAGLPINTNKVWGDIARYRAADPNFMKDVPAKNDEEFDAWVKSRETTKRAQAQDVVRRESGLGQHALGFGTGIAVGLVDPINVGGMLATAGFAGGAKTLLGSMAREAAINAAIETTELPSIISNRSQFGETVTPLEAVEDVGAAALGGGILPVAGKVGRAIAEPALRPIGEAISPGFDPFRQRAAERALGINDLPGATDADVLRAFTDRVPPAARTPEAQAAFNVLGRETEIRGASPYAPSPGGLDAHAEKLGVVADALSQPASVGKAPITPKPQGRSTLPLTQDRIIKFVLNDLEGGATVVPYSQADGGTTKYGVAKKFNPDVDVANITEADAARIARQRYWLPEFNTVDPRVASIAFDANWIRSPTLARRIVREAGDDVSKALDIYRAELMHVADVVPGKARYRKGWNNRVDKLARFVGDAEASTVKLAPEHFDGDDIAYRAATEDLNREELRLADDTPREPDPVRDFVDRQQAGDDLSTPEAQRFASDNAGAISAELQRRADLGTEGHPDLTASRRAPDAGTITEPSPTETALAVRQYVEQGMGEATPESVARDLGITTAEARTGIEAAQVNIATRAERLAAFDVATASLDTIKPTDQRQLWHVKVGDKTQVVSSVESARREVLSAASGTGDYDKIFDKVMKWDGRPRKFGGVEVKRLNEGQHEAAARQRIESQPVAVEPIAPPPSLDPKTYGVDTPTDPQAKMLADSAYHDVKALADAGDTTRAELTEGGPEMNAKELVESLDKDQSVIDAIRNCL
jgi:hypothetical protein